MNKNHVFYLVALSAIPGIGSLLVRQLIAHFGSPEAVFFATKGKLLKVPGIGERHSNEILKKETFSSAEQIMSDAEKYHLKIITILDNEFPIRLKETPDAPLYLYWQGKLSPSYNRSIAVVGTRKATEYGKEVTDKIVRELKEYDPIIVSGFAYGIDIVAHKAALTNGLKTIAVLGGGHGKIYPTEHKKYVEEVMENGAMVSEYTFLEEPLQMHFPARNRIVAGMTDAVIVVEAAESGGALITAEIANSYNREVFAVPGNVGNKFSEGCNKLIQNNMATIFTSVKDLAEALRWEKNTNAVTFDSTPKIPLTPVQTAIYTLLKSSGELHIDDLSWKAQLNINQVASLLLEMEIMGCIKPLPGKKFKVI